MWDTFRKKAGPQKSMSTIMSDAWDGGRDGVVCVVAGGQGGPGAAGDAVTGLKNSGEDLLDRRECRKACSAQDFLIPTLV